MPLADGQVFAGYTILRILGAGGMGEVYLAHHPRLPRRDALKVLGPTVSADEEFRQRFNLEAEMVATLNHPNIVTIYDRGDFEGQLWIAMEFVDGTDAAHLLTEQYPNGIPAADLVDIVTGVAAALDYAHSRGVLHRDIKPANILIGSPDSGDKSVLLADFGVARWIGKQNNLTGVDMTVGTVTYAAPEQLMGEEIDGHADQYALAATAYHLLTGTAPFTATNPAIVISQHLSSPPPIVGAARPELSQFGPVFARALAKNPQSRYETCSEFAAALRSALTPDTGAARHRRAEPPPRRRRTAVLVAAGLAIAATAGAVVAALTFGHHRHQHTATTTATSTAPPPAVAGRMDLPVVVIGADCAVLGAAAVTEDGSPAYCARDSTQPSDTVWSPQPERLRTSSAPAPDSTAGS
ncbi:MAG: serine/threonine protein kinase [Mycobacterium sp.]|nr:serine/threonine protein kinase [Mycobacterium sp.]